MPLLGVYKGRAMAVYHWTSIENAEIIMREGLQQGSFVCAEPDIWSGEVCLVIEELNIFLNDETWQGITHRHVAPSEIVIKEEKDEL